MSGPLSALITKARLSLESNIVRSRRGPMLAAGQNQFQTFWTRDFCFSVPALLRLGHAEVVRTQLEALLKHQRRDGLLPRGLDVLPPQLRVLANTIGAGRWLPSYETRELFAEYLGEHRTPAFDSNVLVTLATARYVAATGDSAFLHAQRERLQRAMDYYLAFAHEGVFHQPAYSDWQDSAYRRGPGLYMHVLLLLAEREADRLELRLPWLRGLEARVGRMFFAPEAGLFRQHPRRPQYPLEANLWIAEHALLANVAAPDQVMQALQASPLWLRLGVPVTPAYRWRHISWTTKLVGLRHYHDGWLWSWLVAEAARVARRLGISAQAVEEKLIRFGETSDWIGEIYQEDGRPFRSWLYRSEEPFSWGAAKIIEALD